MTEHDSIPSKDGQADAQIPMSFNVAVIGGETLAACIADKNLMSKPNWSGEIAARVFRAMVGEAVAQGVLAIRRVPVDHAAEAA